MVGKLWRRATTVFKSGQEESFLEAGINYLNAGEYGKALSWFDEIIRVDPINSEAYRLKGNVYWAAGDLDMALAHYDKAIELGMHGIGIDVNYGDAEAYTSRGLIYYYKGAHDYAISDFTRAIEILPTQVVHDREEKTFESEEARLRSKEYISHFSARIAAVHNNRGNAYRAVGEFDQAIEDYGAAISLQTEVSVYHSNRGGTYVFKGEFSEAIPDLRQALLLDSQNEQAYVSRGHVFTQAGDYAKAAEDFRRAIELNTDYVTYYFSNAYYSGMEGGVRPYTPYDIINTIRQFSIVEGVRDAVDSWRARQGLPEALPSSTLGKAALKIATRFAEEEIESPEQVYREFDQYVLEGEDEYVGRSSVAYYRETWPMHTPDEEIIDGMAAELCRQIHDQAFEDCGFGIACGYTDDSYSRFGVFVAIGYGNTDGSAYAVLHINEAREAAGVPRLRISYPLRLMARKYRPMAEIPDDDTLREDITQYAYLSPGWRARWYFNGAYSPLLRDVLPEAFALQETSPYALVLRHNEMGELAASALLTDHQDILLRSDWQDIAVTTSISGSQEDEKVQAEFLIAWKIPHDAERPSHFPPEPEQSREPSLE